MDKQPQNLNSWSLRSEWENVSLFVLAIGLVMTVISFAAEAPAMFTTGFLTLTFGLVSFLFFNARRTRKQKRNRPPYSPR